MSVENKINESIDFVSRHYDGDAFDASRTLENIGFEKRKAFRFSSRNIAAAVAAVAIAASACLLVFNNTLQKPVTPTPVKVESPATSVPVAERSHKIEFNNASLKTVAAEIENVYGVELENLPATDHRLTLSYEGTAADLVETINDLLGTDIRIRKSGNNTIDPDKE